MDIKMDVKETDWKCVVCIHLETAGRLLGTRLSSSKATVPKYFGNFLSS
jgi:hypothetical protein